MQALIELLNLTAEMIILMNIRGLWRLTKKVYKFKSKEIDLCNRHCLLSLNRIARRAI